MENKQTLGCLKIQGIDAKKFLQGQLTCDVEKIKPQHNNMGALCNPQGRVINIFHLFLHNEIYYLVSQRNMIALTQTTLKKYAVFFKVEMQDVSESMHTLHILPELNLHELQPIIYPETSGKFLPHELNLDQLNAISFDKGCYTGQEIIARMHYKGKLKNRLYHMSVASVTAPIPGADIYTLENTELKTCGTIVTATEVKPNQFDFLAITSDASLQSKLFLDVAKQFPITILNNQ